MNKRNIRFLIVITLSIFVSSNISHNGFDSISDQITNLSIAEGGDSEIIPNWINVSQAPFDLITPEGITNPVLTASDVTDIDAEFVADPFLFYENSSWYMFFEVYVPSKGRGKLGSLQALMDYIGVISKLSFRKDFISLIRWF